MNVWIGRCKECPGDPGCWDYVKDPKTGKDVRVSFCRVSMAKEAAND